MHLRDAGAEAVGGDVAVVHVGAHLGVAQGQQQLADQLDIRRRQTGEHVALFAEGVIVLGVFLHLGPGLDVGAVVVLTRIADGVPVGHHHRSAGGIVEQFVGLPQWPVMKIGRRLQIETGFLIAAGNLVAKPATRVAEGVADRLDGGRLDLDTHGVDSCGYCSVGC
ncbi:hypothetical protein D3C87_1367180 [compost metagenome]